MRTLYTVLIGLALVWLFRLAGHALAGVTGQRNALIVLVKPRRTLLSENFHTPMDSFHCWLYEAV